MKEISNYDAAVILVKVLWVKKIINDATYTNIMRSVKNQTEQIKVAA